MANAKSDAPASLFQPLRSPTFRNLLIADVVSDVGTFMQSVGAAWLMVSLNAGPMFVALTQTASALPFFILALPAGAIGDIVDRRKVILFTEAWMVSVAAVLAAMTIAGKMSPVLLLVLTFALSAGDAFETPTWRAVLPELVSKEDLPAASALNGIEFNFARAVGPALAGFCYRVCGNRHGVPFEHAIVCWSHSSGGALETGRRQAEHAVGNGNGCNRRGDSVCQVLPGDPHCAGAGRNSNVLR